MEYSIHKDKSIENTINRIKSILKNLSLNTKIKEFSYKNNNAFSCRIFLSDIEEKDIGTNGKGTCKQNALASGYAEFMERLQTHLLLDFSSTGDVYFEPDEIILPPEKINESILAEDFNLNNKIHQYCSLLNQLMAVKRNINFDSTKESFIPFVSVKTKKKVFVPTMPLLVLLGSNGFASGNTIKEAIVQGLSEICERDILNDIMKDKITLCNIPEELYNKYEKITDLIKFIEKNEFKVTIKGITSDKQFPVVAALFEDSKTGLTELKLGSSPFLPVAIERTLTEFLQGFLIEDEEKRNLYRQMFLLGGDFINSVKYNCTKSCLVFEKDSQILQKHLQANGKFYKTAFLSNENADNEQAYNFLIDKILNVADDIYVRDYSCFGFPTVVLYVPQFSPLWEICEDKLLDIALHYLKWDLYFHGIDKLEDKSLDSLILASKVKTLKSPRIELALSDIPSEIITLLCYIIKKDTKSVQEYLEKTFMVFDDLVSEETRQRCINFFTPIKNYYDLLSQNLSEEQISEKFDNKKQYNRVKNIIDNYTYDDLIQLLKKHSSKRDDMSKIQDVIEHLHEVYIKHIPNQDNLIKIL